MIDRIISPLTCYQQALAKNGYQPDDVQHKAIICLNSIWQALCELNDKPDPFGRSFWGKLEMRLTKNKNRVQSPLRGLYMWGGPGRGKTWLMDMFFQSIPGKRKLRLHFHRFMLRVHDELTQLQGQSNPLLRVADRFKDETDILCFDEFFVSDITDAMLLGTLLEALFARGITLVVTSNILPDELYPNGLQRARFLPAIALIKRYCDVINVDAGIDYRLGKLASAHLWIHPLSGASLTAIDKMYQALTGEMRGKEEIITINHRAIHTMGSDEGVLAIDFKALCGQGRSQHDYVEISRLFHTILLYNMPVMSHRDEDAARRFLALVDEFYERHVKLIVLAATSFQQIYQGILLKFQYQRCLSRLEEMQSEEYLRLPHLP